MSLLPPRAGHLVDVIAFFSVASAMYGVGLIIVEWWLPGLGGMYFESAWPLAGLVMLLGFIRGRLERDFGGWTLIAAVCGLMVLVIMVIDHYRQAPKLALAMALFLIALFFGSLFLLRQKPDPKTIAKP